MTASSAQQGSTGHSSAAHSRQREVLHLLSKLNHDIRSPLAVVQSFINIMELQDYRCNPDDLREMAVSMQEAIEKGLKEVDAGIDALKIASAD